MISSNYGTERNRTERKIRKEITMLKGIDRYITGNYGEDQFDGQPCDVCGYPVDDCICPVCPRCGQVGDPGCYQEVDLGICGGLHGCETVEQQIGRLKYEISLDEEQLREKKMYLDKLEQRAMMSTVNKKKED